MVDCEKCKHHYIKMLDKYTGRSDCKKGHFKTVSNVEVEPPKECSDFESKDLTDEEQETMKNLHVCPNEGKKYDTGKNRMGLMCENFSRALWEVAKVSTFGSQKYGDNTWQNLSNPKKRYMDALCRHLFQHLQGKKVDDESGLLHLQHMCWNALALLEFELKDDNMTCVLKQSLDKVQEDMKVGGILKALKESEKEND